MYKRFFAFGCSFTMYHWVTWADIVAYSYPDAKYFNFGVNGGGNQQILSRIMEADQLYKFTKDDLIIVQWTNVAREDRYLDGHWATGGNVYSNSLFDEQFIKKYCNNTHFLLRDLAAIKSVNAFLKGIGCTYFNLSMVDINTINQYENTKVKDIEQTNLFETYKDVLGCIKPSFHSTLFNCDWWSRTPRPTTIYSTGVVCEKDPHPTPAEHLEYLKTVLPELPLAQDIESVISKVNETVLSTNNLSSLQVPVRLGNIKRPSGAMLKIKDFCYGLSGISGAEQIYDIH